MKKVIYALSLLVLLFAVQTTYAVGNYTKIANNGTLLADSATQGTGDFDWACTKDNDTGLIWEVKTDDGGLHDKDNYYALDFVTDVNAQSGGLCGATDWYLPSKDELKGLVYCSNGTTTPLADLDDCGNGYDQPTIVTEFFPRTTTGYAYRSSTTGSRRWHLFFSSGISVDRNYLNAYSRLVRGGQTLSFSPKISEIPDQSTHKESPIEITFSIGDEQSVASELILSGSSSNTSLVPNSNIVFGGSGTQRTVTVTPLSDQLGTTTITVGLSDGSDSVSESFTVTVEMPQLSDVPDQSTHKASQESPIEITFSIGDERTVVSELTLTGSSSNTSLVPNSNIVFGGSGTQRTVTVTPLSDQLGTTTITIVVSHGSDSVSESFTVTVEMPPTISAIADQSIDEDTATAAIPFTVGDTESAASALTVTATSSNQILVPDSNVVISGTAADRTVIVTPVAAQGGVATITLTVDDGVGTTTENFLLTVNGHPTISAIADQSSDEESATQAIDFTVGDPESSAGSLVVTAGSSNTSLLPDQNVVLGGSGADRTITLAPAVDQHGEAVVTITVSDGAISQEMSFTYTVNAVNDFEYIKIGKNGARLDDTAQLGSGPFDWACSRDLDTDFIWEVKTDDDGLRDKDYLYRYQYDYGSGYVDVSGGYEWKGTTDITSDGYCSSSSCGFSTLIDAANGAKLCGGNDWFLPSSSQLSGLIYSGSAPQIAPDFFPNTGSTFDYANIYSSWNGEQYWTSTPGMSTDRQQHYAYLVDFESGGSTQARVDEPRPVRLARSGALSSSPMVSLLDDLTIGENTSSGNAFTIGDEQSLPDALTLSASSSNIDLLPIENITFSGSGHNRTVTVAPAQGSIGTATVTVTVSDGSDTVSENFVLTVNDSPTIGVIADQSSDEDTSINSLSFSVSDTDNSVGSLVVTASSSDTALVPNEDLIVGGSDANRTLSITPAEHQNGVVTITLTVSDGYSSTNQTFLFTISPVDDAPTLTEFSDVITSTKNGVITSITMASLEAQGNENDVDGTVTGFIVTSVEQGVLFIGESAVSATRWVADSNDRVDATHHAYWHPPAGLTGSVNAFSVRAISENGVHSLSDISVSILIDFPASSLALDQLDGSNGQRLIGIDQNDSSGYAVSGIGDLNGDGYEDIIIGAAAADFGWFADTGESYVVFGKAEGWDGSDTLSSLVDGSSAFGIVGIDGNDLSGYSVSGAGDLDADGFGDLIIGAPSANSGAGESYIIFGKKSGWSVLLSLDDLSDGVRVDGASSGNNSGSWLSSAGDVNGDGYGDLLIGAAGSTNSYLLLGRSRNDWPVSISLATLDSSSVIQLAGTHYDQVVSSVGDLNGDGYGDLVVGSSQSSPAWNDAVGSSYLLFGKPRGWSDTVDLTALSGSDGFRLDGINDGDGSGGSVSSAGDFNGDGYSDLIIGAADAGDGAGQSYLIFGGSFGWPPAIGLSALNGANGFRIDGVTAGDRAGAVVSSVGDVNGDGYDDLLIGAPGVSTEAGASYLLFGRSGTWTSPFSLADLDGSNGFYLTGVNSGDHSGFALGGAGDVNGDGYDDLIVGSYGVNTATGESALIFGGSSGWSVATQVGLSTGDLLVGSSGVDRILSGNGSDTITGGGGADVLYGGRGNDTVTVADLNFFRVNGGTGDDTLKLALSVDLTATSLLNKIHNIETIDLSGGGDNTLTIGVSELLRITDSNNRLTLEGDAGDVIDLQGDWVAYGESDGYYRLTASGVKADLYMSNTLSLSNKAPVANGASVSVTEDQIYNGTFDAVDINGDDLTYSVVSDASNGNVVINGGGYSYTPQDNYDGTDSFTFKANDGTVDSNTATISLTVQGVNDPPTISAIANQSGNEDEQSAPIEFTVGDLETSLGSLTVVATSSNTDLVRSESIDINSTEDAAVRSMDFGPVANQSGSTTITVSVSDGEASSRTSFTYTVGSTNDLPTITSIADQSSEEDSSTVPAIFAVADAESASSSLTVSAISSNLALLSNESIILAGENGERTIALVPNGNQNGSTTVTVTVTDGVASQNTSFVYTVLALNDRPTISTISNQNSDEDVATEAIAFTIGDVESAASGLTVTASSSNTALVDESSISFEGTGSTRTVTITPLSHQSGTAIITLTVLDGLASSSTQFDLVVAAVDDAPVITGSPEITALTAGDSFSFTPTASDVDGTTLSYQITNQPSWATFDTTTGALSGTPKESDYGSYNNITLTVVSGNKSTALTPFSLAVEDQKVPVVENTLAAGAYNESQTIALSCSDSGSGCDAIYYTLDGSDPMVSTQRHLYTTEISLAAVSAVTVLKSYAEDIAGNSSEVEERRYEIDLLPPDVAVTSVEDGASVAWITLSELIGTATDANSGLESVEVSVSTGGQYLKTYISGIQEMQSDLFWNPVEDYDVKRGISNAVDWDQWYLPLNNSRITPDELYTISVRAMDRAGNQSDRNYIIYIEQLNGGVQLNTAINQTLSSQSVRQNNTLDVSGQISLLGQADISLKDKQVKLIVTPPVGTGSATELTTTTTDELGHFTFPSLDLFSHKGNYTLTTRFEDSGILVGSSATNSVLVGASAGYAILVHGKFQPTSGEPEGLASHKKSTNRVYQELIERGFAPENIKYFQFDTDSEGYANLPGVNVDEPTKSKVQGAIETWARQKIKDVPAPLYIVMVDHGEPDAFYIGQQSTVGTITPSDLNGWLNNLEAGLEQDSSVALEEDRVVILGACYSGSFIDDLSKEGRTIITSAAADERSYKGAKEPDGIRVGEFFIAELFNELGHGYSLQKSFTLATNHTENKFHQRGRSANSINQYFDSAKQHPLLDDDGDGVGSNSLTATGDGLHAESIFLGVGKTFDTNSAENPAEFVESTPTQTLSVSANAHLLLWAKDNVGGDAPRAWLEIMTPETSLDDSSSDSFFQIEVDLPEGGMQYNAINQRWELNTLDIANFNGFITSGTYEIYYYIQDKDTGEITSPWSSTLYKEKRGNTPPNSFNLLAPATDSEVEKLLVLDWESTTDLEGDPISYTLTIASDINFSNVLLNREGISTSTSWIDSTVSLQDQTDYYWKITATDLYGSITVSTTYHFTTNFTNSIPGIVQGIVFSNSDSSRLGGATLQLSNGQIITTEIDGSFLASLLPGNYSAALKISENPVDNPEVASLQVTANTLSRYLVGVVTDANAVPQINGAPITTIQEGQTYHFTVTATDADSDPLTFSVLNLPSWLTLSATTGTLTGTPVSTDVRVYNDIEISVSDGKESASLSVFSIEVTAIPPLTNHAPQISGTPITSIQEGQAYSLNVTATDADSDPLTFSAQNLPGWISLDITTGELTGTPASTDVGVYNNIEISVSDGVASASISPFSIEVTVIPSPPREMPLTLHGGWNLSHFTKETTVTTIKQQVPEIDAIWSFLNCDKKWEYALFNSVSNTPIAGSNLTALEPGKGYWIKVTGIEKDQEVTVSLSDAVTNSITLQSVTYYSGWNSVGVTENVVISETEIPEEISSIWGWEEYWVSHVDGVPIFLNSLQLLDQNKGYFIYSDQDGLSFGNCGQ